MADNISQPQNGEPFTKLPNAMVTALLGARLSSAAWQILSVVIRYTLGFNRDRHPLSKSFFAQATRRHLRVVGRALDELRKHGILRQYSPATFRVPATWGIRPVPEWKGEVAKTGRGDKNATPPTDGKIATPTDGKIVTSQMAFSPPIKRKENRKEKRQKTPFVFPPGESNNNKPRSRERRIKAESADPTSLFDLFECRFGTLDVDPLFSREIATVMVGCKASSLHAEFKRVLDNVGDKDIPPHLTNTKDLFRTVVVAAAHRANGGQTYGG